MDIVSRLHSSLPKAAPYLVLAIAFVLLIANAQYSFNWIDESFYAALVDNLNKGAVPFVDEWHPAQVYAPLLLPFYKIYLAAFGSSTGVIYFFRLIYTLFAFIVSIVIYRALNKDFGKFAPLCCALVYLFYVRANILGPSYYSLCLSFFILGLLASMHAFKQLKNDDGEAGSARVLLPLAAGAAFGLACICNPYTIFFILVTCITAVIYSIYAKQRSVIASMLWLIIGAAIVAIIYFWFIFLRTSPTQLFENIGNVLASHDENLSFWQRIPNYISYLPITRVGAVSFAAVTIILAVMRLRHLYFNSTTKLVSLIVCTVILVYDCACIFQTGQHPAKIMLAFAEFAVPCYLLSERLSFKYHPEIALFWLPGIVFSFIWQFSSNTQICGILIGYCVACMGAIITVSKAVPLQKGTFIAQLVTSVLSMACVMCFVACVVVVRIFSVYSDCEYSNMTAQIKTGPAAGLYTSEQHLAQYEGLENLLAKIDNSNSVWVEPMAPWAYLEVEGRCGAISTWNSFMNSADAETYYGKQGHEYPGWILVTNDDLGKSVNVLVGRVQENVSLKMYYEYNATLRKVLKNSKEYAPIASNDCGVLYKRAEHSYISAPK